MDLSRWLRSLGVVGAVALVSTGCAWTQRVDVDDQGNQGLIGASGAAVSGNGRYVAFESFDALGTGDPVNSLDVLLRDTATGRTRKVGSGGSEAAISADGGTVAFVSAVPSLVPGDTNNTADVFVQRMATGAVERVNVATAGGQANNFSSRPTVSADGRFVAFDSIATNLVPGDTNHQPDVFLRDTVTGTTTRVSVATGGAQADDGSIYAAISSDGRFVAFSSNATNLVSGDTNGQADTFIRDTVSGTTTRVNVGPGGVQADHAGLERPSISADGRFVVFTSAATNIVAGDSNDTGGVFVRDTVAGTTTRVSFDDTGQPLPGATANPVVSGDGRFVAFQYDTSSLPGHSADLRSVLVRDRVGGTIRTASLSTNGTAANGPSGAPAISADGRYIAFDTDASNLVSGDTNGVRDVVVRANPQPGVTGVAASTLPRGTAVPLSVSGSGFLSGAVVVVDGPGVSISGVTVVSPSAITATVTVDPSAPPTARNVWVELPGTGPGLTAGALGVCAACVTVT